MSSDLLAPPFARSHKFICAAILLVSAPLFASITVNSPQPNTSITSPIRFVASATPTSTSPVTAMQVYVDGQLLYTIPTTSMDVFLPLNIGTHTVAFKAWNSSGGNQIRSQTNTVRYGISIASPRSGVSLNTPVHISANAKSSTAIIATKVYVDDSLKFSTSSSSVDTSLSMAAGTRHIVVQSWDQAGRIYKESLYVNVITTASQLIGRDQFLQQKYQAGPAHVDGRYGFTFNNFLLEGASSVRNLGSRSIFVYLYPGFRDYTDSKLTRTINAVVPTVKPDMVTYSSYDSSLQGTDSTSLAAAMNRALNTIKSLSADPMYLRNRRILISEYGLFENVSPTETTWRSSAILKTANAAGLSGAFLWQLYDNECKMSNGDYFPVDSSPGSLTRPRNSDCLGLWLIKPDGTKSAVLPIVSGYW